MAQFVAQAMVFFDGADQNDAWAQAQAEWIHDNTKVLTGQALVVPGTAGERSSYCLVSQVNPDGTLTPIKAWHVNNIGLVTDGLPDGSAQTPVFAEWAPGVTYAINDVVTYNSVQYRCIQGHSSQVGWEPPNVASLWTAI